MARDRNSRKGLIPIPITLSHAPVRIPTRKVSETKPTNHDTVLSFGFLQPVPVCLCSEYSCEVVFLLYPSKRWTCDREMAGTVPGRFPREFRSTLDSGNGDRVFNWAEPCPQPSQQLLPWSLPVPFATALASNSSSTAQLLIVAGWTALCKLGFCSFHSIKAMFRSLSGFENYEIGKLFLLCVKWPQYLLLETYILMDRKREGGVKKYKKYQLNWIWTFLVKPVYRQTSSKLVLLAVVFFGLGWVFWGWGRFF